MGKGYAEVPAAEERFEAMERGEGIERRETPVRHAVYGSTADDPEKSLHRVGRRSGCGRPLRLWRGVGITIVRGRQTS